VEGNFIRSVSFTWSPSGLRGEFKKKKKAQYEGMSKIFCADAVKIIEVKNKHM
jgi:hypothetical protein